MPSILPEAKLARRQRAPFLPMSQKEMKQLGWTECDIILVTGDAYIDHPSFGMAVIGRVLESHGYRVGIISQPDWNSTEPFKILGKPRLYFGVTAGNMDSMINRYTAERRMRHEDAYTPHNEGGKRPDRAVLVYTQRCKQAYKGVPVVIGGIEASLRRVAHYDYWSDKVRRSWLFDSKADLLVFGNGERAVLEIAQRMEAGEEIRQIQDVRGTACNLANIPDGFAEAGKKNDSQQERIQYEPSPTGQLIRNQGYYLRMPSCESVKENKIDYARASRILHLETNPFNAKALVQQHGDRELWLNPPALPLTSEEMDFVFDHDYARAPHPVYDNARIPAWEMIRFSINIIRGCFGGCTFCSITEHEGRVIQRRSEKSILQELGKVRERVKGFTGTISDLGGPSANMYGLGCSSPEIHAACKKPSCIYPKVCKHLNTDHSSLVDLYRKSRQVPGIKKVLVASGVRYDLALEDKNYIKELVSHHVGGYLKIAPEHTEEETLKHMLKPSIDGWERFEQLFNKYSGEANKEQYLIPYFMSAHPGTTDLDMVNLALWLKSRKLKLDQVQNFYPTPMSTATAMYHSGVNPLAAVGDNPKEVTLPFGGKQRKLHKALLRYHDPDNWAVIHEALTRMGLSDLIGSDRHCLIPACKPRPQSRNRSRASIRGRKRDPS